MDRGLSGDVVFLRIMPEGPIVHLQQFRSSRSNAITCFYGRHDIGALQFLDVLFKIETTLGQLHPGITGIRIGRASLRAG